LNHVGGDHLARCPSLCHYWREDRRDDTIASISTISGQAAWPGRELQDDGQWIEMLSNAEITESAK